MPPLIVAAFVFCFGVIIGSFLNVVIYRLHTSRSLAGRSHCLSCGVTLEWYDLLPLVSYLVLRARCRSCAAVITPRYFLVELATGLLFVGVAFTSPWIVPVLIWWAVMAVLVVIVVYDYYHFIIPDALVGWLIALALAWHGYQWWQTEELSLFWYSALAATAAAGFFAALWAISRGRWLGLGDAKLAFPLGLLLPPAATFSFLVLSFWLGAVISLAVIAWQYLRRRGQPHLRFLAQPLTIKSEVPFAPFLVLGFMCVYFWSIDALQLVSFVF